MRRLYFTARFLLAIAAGILVAGCAASLPTRDALSAAGPRYIDKAAFRTIIPGTAASNQLQVGDTVVAVDSTNVGTIAEFLQAVSPLPRTFTVLRASGERLTMPISTLFDFEKESANAFLLGPEDSFTADIQSLTGLSARGGYFSAGSISGSIAVSRWNVAPSILELEIYVDVPKDCMDCEIRDIAVMDWGRRAWLSTVPFDQVAYTLVPDIGSPGVPIAVPPPRVVGSTSTTTMNGTVNAQSYGNTVHGNYSGTAYTSTTPIYDYSNQYAAAGHNLGVAIRNSQIQSTNRLRGQFSYARVGNLRTGKLNPGEKVTGHLFFAAPPGFGGPYAVFVYGPEGKVGAIKFE